MDAGDGRRHTRTYRQTPSDGLRPRSYCRIGSHPSFRRQAQNARELLRGCVEKHIADSGLEGRSAPVPLPPLIHLNAHRWFSANLWPMSPADEPDRRKEAPKPKPSRTEEARRIIEEYAESLREVIRKLRRHLN